ncbi:uncharacterized protein LACBIDRAFT_399323, partial [Laccaria bicolor S238N-H82]
LDFAIITGWKVCHHEANHPAPIGADLLKFAEVRIVSAINANK